MTDVIEVDFKTRQVVDRTALPPELDPLRPIPNGGADLEHAALQEFAPTATQLKNIDDWLSDSSMSQAERRRCFQILLHIIGPILGQIEAIHGLEIGVHFADDAARARYGDPPDVTTRRQG